MAFPSMESFCCMATKPHHDVEWIFNKNFLCYNIVCTVSAVFGLLGAIYQLLPYTEEITSRRHTLCIRSQRKIIRWLAFADVLATSGILIRSITWIANSSSARGIIFCTVMSTWIHFSYSATYFWTLLYAVDVYLASKEKTCKLWKYHATVWSLATVLTSISLFTLYFPDFKCHEKSTHVLINYIFTDLPIVLVMVVNPILYVLATKQIKYLLASCHAQFSDNERKMLSAIREKFISIVLVFYCCWTTNIVSGIVLWTTWTLSPNEYVSTMMFMMAVLNPLQALLNSLVYRGWTLCRKTITNLCCPALLIEGTLFSSRSEILPVLEEPLVDSE